MSSRSQAVLGLAAALCVFVAPAAQAQDKAWSQIYGFAMTDVRYDREAIDPSWFDVMRPTKLAAFENQFGEEGSVARPTFRTYFASAIGGDGSADPISSGGRTDFQPGGAATPFDIRPDVWVRFTLSITWDGGQQRLRLWMADEQRDPVLVIADPADPSRGFLVDNTNPDVGLDRFLVLFDTSQTPAQHPELHAWVRNLVVFKDATVPLGGRPGGRSKSAG